jgi:hypothetical protein
MPKAQRGAVVELSVFTPKRSPEPAQLDKHCCLIARRTTMAKKRTARGRKQDRARVAGGEDYEVRYEAKKTHRSKTAVKKAVNKVGNSRKKVERRLAR